MKLQEYLHISLTFPAARGLSNKCPFHVPFIYLSQTPRPMKINLFFVSSIHPPDQPPESPWALDGWLTILQRYSDQSPYNSAQKSRLFFFRLHVLSQHGRQTRPSAHKQLQGKSLYTVRLSLWHGNSSVGARTDHLINSQITACKQHKAS